MSFDAKTEPIIKVQNLSKRYRIGQQQESSDTLVGAILNTFRRPLRNLRDIRKLTAFSEDEGEDVIWALQDISFEVRQGEVLGIVGPNGAGKSTLLKILSRITAPTLGRIEITGRVSSLLEVGTGFHDELTGFENIYLNGTILGMTKSEIDAKLEQIVRFADIGKFVDTPLKRYSTGMRARLAFAVAAFLEPEILLVDEVLAVGDASFRNKSYVRMQKLARGGRTVLFVSHNLEAIRTFCSRAIFLDEGHLVEDGEPVAVVNHYLERIAQKAHYELIPDMGEQNEQVSAERIVLRDWAGQPRTEFGPGDGIELVLDYVIHERWDNFLIRLRIFAEDGTNVLTSGETSVVESQPGRYRCICRLPSGLLNHGHYEIQLFALHGGSYTMFARRNELFFFVRHQADLMTNEDVLPGLLAPQLVQWQVDRSDA